MAEKSKSEKVAESAKIASQAQGLQGEIVELRRHLHEHPELGFAEFETAKLAAEKLESSGFKVKKGVGKTGVVADLANDRGPLIAIRADMTACRSKKKRNCLSFEKSLSYACLWT